MAIFAANRVSGSPPGILTGGLFDRLKGMSAYLEWCLAFGATPLVVWDKPLSAHELFEEQMKIRFITSELLEDLGSYRVVNLLNKRARKLKFEEVHDWFASDELVVIHCNFGSNAEIWKGFRDSISGRSALSSFGQRAPSEILFHDFRLRFRKPAHTLFDQTGRFRLGFHLRVGGNQSSWQDPLLSDPRATVARIQEILDRLVALNLMESLEVAVCGDCEDTKSEVVNLALSYGVRVFHSNANTFHLDRSPDDSVESATALLEDIELLGSSDFIFRSAGAFGSMVARYAGKPYGDLSRGASLSFLTTLLGREVLASQKNDDEVS